ncbi:hypothetical protein ACROYT_G015597 [Oculina patagonica]
MASNAVDYAISSSEEETSAEELDIFPSSPKRLREEDSGDIDVYDLPRPMMQGKSAWWCPTKCLLPWTADEKKPALYAELRVRVLEEYQNPNPVPYCEIHNEPCKLEVVNKEKCKEERLANKLFFTCARKKDDSHCSFVKSAEIHGEKGEAFALMFKNRKSKNFQNLCSVMQQFSANFSD